MVYIFVVTIKVVYLQCVKAITHADMMNLYLYLLIACVVGY